MAFQVGYLGRLRTGLVAVLTFGMIGGVAQASPLTEGPFKWVGEGQFRSEIGGPVRKARCKFSSSPTEEDGFSLTGKCAAPSGSATVGIRVQRLANGRLGGTMESSVFDYTVDLDGVEGSSLFALVSREPLDIEDKPMRFQLELGWQTPGALTLNEWLTPEDSDETTQMVWITMTRK